MFVLQSNPHGTVSSLNKTDRERVENATIPMLSEILAVAMGTNKSVMLTTYDQPSPHRHSDDYMDIIINTILKSGIKQQQVLSFIYY